VIDRLDHVNSRERKREKQQTTTMATGAYWCHRACEVVTSDLYDRTSVSDRIEAMLGVIKFCSMSVFCVGDYRLFETMLLSIKEGDAEVVADPCAIPLVVMIAYPAPGTGVNYVDTAWSKGCLRDTKTENIARHQRAVDALVNALATPGTKWERNQALKHLLDLTRVPAGLEKIHAANVTKISNALSHLGTGTSDKVAQRRIERIVMATERPSLKRSLADLESCGFA
jgi:hypothetical protein